MSSIGHGPVGGRMLSAHFQLFEFGCKCGRWPDCTKARPAQLLISCLERARARHYPGGLVIESGVRCATHNRAVGGAARSQHVSGQAADLRDRVMTIKEAIGCGFTGIGVNRDKRGVWRVSHVDVRSGSVTVWQYPSRGPVPYLEWT